AHLVEVCRDCSGLCCSPASVAHRGSHCLRQISYRLPDLLLVARSSRSVWYLRASRCRTYSRGVWILRFFHISFEHLHLDAGQAEHGSVVVDELPNERSRAPEPFRLVLDRGVLSRGAPEGRAKG